MNDVDDLRQALRVELSKLSGKQRTARYKLKKKLQLHKEHYKIKSGPLQAKNLKRKAELLQKHSTKFRTSSDESPLNGTHFVIGR
jgi:hypothetical protein